MDYIRGLEAYQDSREAAITLGKFDGVHRGHQKLLNRIMKYAQKEDCDSVVCAFDMDRDCLMTNEERRAFLEDKVDYLIEIPFTREMMEMEAEKFIDEILHKKLHASHIVVGTDFNFGHEKRGNHQMLEKYAAKYGYTVDVVEKAYYKDREISSTYIRELLLDGNVPLANKLLHVLDQHLTWLPKMQHALLEYLTDHLHQALHISLHRLKPVQPYHRIVVPSKC